MKRPPPSLAAAKPLLEAHRWPGNVRELRNVIERAVVLCDGADAIDPEHLASIAVAPKAGKLKDDLSKIERDRIVHLATRASRSPRSLRHRASAQALITSRRCRR
jgi:transcriptional regulator with PAS, ATPase and Fis domain